MSPALEKLVGVAPAARWSAAWRVLGRLVGDLPEACLSSRPDTPRAWPKAAGPDRVGVRASGTAAAGLGLRGPREGRGHLDRGWRGALGGGIWRDIWRVPLRVAQVLREQRRQNCWAGLPRALG